MTSTTGVVSSAWAQRLQPDMPAVMPRIMAGNDNAAANQKRRHCDPCLGRIAVGYSGRLSRIGQGEVVADLLDSGPEIARIGARRCPYPRSASGEVDAGVVHAGLAGQDPFDSDRT